MTNADVHVIINVVKGVVKLKIRHEDLIGSFEQKKRLVAQFSLFHDIFFSVVMRDKDAAEYVLRLCMDMPDLKILRSNTQQALRNIIGKSSTLDFVAQDSDGKIYNIEVQNSDSSSYFGAKRSRYYQSLIDSAFVEKGMDYDKLPEVYILFLTPFNPLEKYDHHKVVYRKNSDLDGVDWDNGVHEIYINSQEKDGTELSEMMQYFITANPEDNRFGALSNAVYKQKTDTEEVSFMCKEVEEYANERAEKAASKTVKSLLDDGMPLEKALKHANISEETYNKYKDIV